MTQCPQVLFVQSEPGVPEKVTLRAVGLPGLCQLAALRSSDCPLGLSASSLSKGPALSVLPQTWRQGPLRWDVAQ